MRTDLDLHWEYTRLWLASYAARFRLGFWARRVLGPAPLFGPVLEFLVRRPALLNRFTPIFHQGFSSLLSPDQ